MLQNIKKLFYEAQALYWLKQYNLAIEKYEAISQHTNNWEYFEQSLVWLAEIYYQTWNYKKALKYYNTYLQIIPQIISRDEIMFKIWKCYLNENNTKKALDYFKYIAAQHPDSIYFKQSQKYLT